MNDKSRLIIAFQGMAAHIQIWHVKLIFLALKL